MNILLTSAGRRTYLVEYFKEALDGIGCVYASNNVLTYTLTRADKFVITPNIYDESYVDFLINYCLQESITAIIPLFDIDLPILSKNKNRFIEHNIRVIVSDENVILICNDKWKTYNSLLSYGLKQPQSFISLCEVHSKITNGELSFPLILKPRWGMGSIAVMEADTIEELDILYNKIKKKIFDSYLKYESSENVDDCVIIQEKIHGQEYGLDVFNDLEGKYITTVAKRKIAMRSGETDIAEIVNPAPFETIGSLLANKLSHIANLDVDCFVADNGDIYVLELNCRFGGQYPFSHNAGVNFPKQIVSFLNGLGVEKNLITPRIGVVSCKEIYPVIFKH